MARVDRAVHVVSLMTMAGIRYPGVMRYADGGGLSERGRATREAVRLQAADLFVQDVAVAEIARRLRVSTNPVYVWRRRWRAGGTAALASKGPGGSSCRLDDTR